MKGSTRTRDRKDGKSVYQVVIDLGCDGNTGKRLRDFKTLPVGTTKREAERILREMLTAVDNQEYVPDSNVTVAEYLRTWMDTYIRPHKSPTTIRGYQVNIERYIIPKFGKTKLQDLSTLAIQKFYNSLAKKSPLSEKPLSPKSIKNLNIIFSMALKRAVMLGIIKKNPSQYVELERCPKYQPDVYSTKELKQLFEALKGTDMELPVLINVTMGLRRGELLGITWDKIDFENNCFLIDRNVVQVNAETVTKSPKSESGRRKIDAPVMLMDMLHKEYVSYKERRLQYGKDFYDSNLVVCQPNGQPFKPDSFSQKFRRFLKQHGLRHIRVHDLRHENATLLLKAGVSPKVAQKRLGHAHYSTTMDIYSHILDEVEKDAVNLLEAELQGIMM